MNPPKNDQVQPKEIKRKEYLSPTLVEYGTIVELTLGGAGQEMDAVGGGPSFGN